MASKGSFPRLEFTAVAGPTTDNGRHPPFQWSKTNIDGIPDFRYKKSLVPMSNANVSVRGKYDLVSLKYTFFIFVSSQDSFYFIITRTLLIHFSPLFITRPIDKFDFEPINHTWALNASPRR